MEVLLGILVKCLTKFEVHRSHSTALPKQILLTSFLFSKIPILLYSCFRYLVLCQSPQEYTFGHNDSLEGLSPIPILMVTLYYRKKIQIQISQGKKHVDEDQEKPRASKCPLPGKLHGDTILPATGYDIINQGVHSSPGIQGFD